MKIVFLCEGFDSFTVIAQPWRHIHEIALRLQKLGHEVKVLTDLVGGLPRNESIHGISVHRIKKHFGLFDFDELLTALNGDNIDVVNWVGGPLSTFYFWRLQNAIRKDIVWTMYKGGLTVEDLKNASLKELFSLLNNVQFLYLLFPKFVVKNGATSPKVRKIIVWSKRTWRYLKDIGVNTDKITIISSGVDTAVFKPQSASEAFRLKEKFGLKSDDPVVLYFGPLVSLRGIDTLILAMDKITKKQNDANLLVLARDYQENKESKFLKSMKNKNNIYVLTKNFSQSDIVKLLGLADTVVLPFKSWPHQECPLTILEAMAMSKTVITTSIWPVEEIIRDGKTGVLVSPNNVDALSEKIVEVLSDREKRAEIGRKARDYVVNFHDWNIIAKKNFDILKTSAQPSAHSSL